MTKYILAFLVFLGMLLGIYTGIQPSRKDFGKKAVLEGSLKEGLALLGDRKDKEADVIFEKIINSQPDNLDALWGKAEVLRRKRDYADSEQLLNKILLCRPTHVPSLISLSYIRYKDDKIEEALNLTKKALRSASNREDAALGYLMLASINSRRSQSGWIFGKVAYGLKIKGYFLKAKELAGDMPEVRLGLGTFYLLAPSIIGGDLDKAISELNHAFESTPEFATVNARLAQAYKKKGDLEKYNFFLKRTRELDPENEVLKEIE